jgi:uncharacterized protein (DUF433 family)
MLGKPVIRGTRIPVELIARKLAEGADEKMVRQADPKLTPEDIRAALRYRTEAATFRGFSVAIREVYRLDHLEIWADYGSYSTDLCRGPEYLSVDTL